MASSVATPLEKQFSTIAGVTSISSSNGQGNTNITLQFDLSRDIDSRRAGRAVDDRRAARSLPPGMPVAAVLQKVNPRTSRSFS
jgi:HAE1 family hydrophobic/amphiphilic exporter-1